MYQVGISTARPQATQTYREIFLTVRGMATVFTASSLMDLAVKPRHGCPSARNTSNEGIMRLLNPINLQL